MFRYSTDVIFNRMQVICQLFVKLFVKVVVYFFAVRDRNDRQTVDGNNSVKFKTTFVGRTSDVFNSKQMSTEIPTL